MTRRGRILLGALLLVAAVAAFLYTEFRFVAAALGGLGVLVGLLPAGRSPYRLVISGVALSVAPWPIVLNRDRWSQAPLYWSQELSPSALVIAAALVALLVAGAAVVAGLGPVTVVASLIALAGLAAAGLSPGRTETLSETVIATISVEALLLLGWSARLAGDRRGWPRTTVVTVLALLASMVIFSIGLVPGVWSYDLIPPVPAWMPAAIYVSDTQDVTLGMVVVGFLVGAVAVGAAVLTRPWSGAAGVLSGQRVEAAQLRRLLGGALALAAIGFWSLGFASVEPGFQVTLGPENTDPDDASVALLGPDLRWAAVVLGVGGVLLMVSGANRRTVAALITVVGWLAADNVGGRLHQYGLVFGLIAGVVVAGIVTVAVVIANRVAPGPQRPVGLRVVYGAVAVGVAFALMFEYADGVDRDLPAGTATAIGALAILLTATGIAVAVTAAPRRSAVQGLIAIVLSGLSVAIMSWQFWMATSLTLTRESRVLLVWLLAVLVFAVIALGLDRPRSWDAWLVLVLAALAAPSLAMASVIGAWWTGWQAEWPLRLLTGEHLVPFRNPVALVGGLAGLTLALLLVGPAAWWSRPRTPRPDPVDARPDPVGGRTDDETTMAVPAAAVTPAP